MKELQYLNFPVSFLRKRDLIEILEMAFLFCSYETMTRENGDRNYFERLIEKKGLDSDETDYFSDAKQLYVDNKKSLRCGVNLSVFANYISTSKDKLNLEFRAYCATKAILGRKVYGKTTLKHIFALMFGYNCIDDMSDKTKLELSGTASVRSMKRILSKLEEKWHLSVYSIHSHGMYISYKLLPVNLIVEVKKDKILLKNKQKLNEKKADAILSDFLIGINADLD